ncbi:ATP-dependent endonuclease [Rufibacter immobilis]|uniref:ATP-dependent endonuclease n=1 Tax=Rufibacter immobilis TaxID=1348778 RepID=A0A3M9MPS6_9BACT|nr:AAA family ATPase [Rufibacter immobilis]RNI27516.1 ATP-dependent endonuclease [Rufibacter immobilis]
MLKRSKLVRMRVVNIGCIGPEGLTIDLDNILCIVGANNSGKSTLLKAYELAVGTISFKKEDRCQRADESPSSVEIWVHIPDGTKNISDDWKEEEGDLKLVRSIWEWSKDDFKKTRKTWDKEAQAYSETEKASGLDTVFTSKLPKPFRIGSLENPETEHKALLTIIIQPIAEQLKRIMNDESSALSKLLKSISAEAKGPVDEHNNLIQTIKGDLNKSHNEIFPNLSIDLNVGIGDIKIDPLAELLKASKFKFKEGCDEIDWNQQGTGSQRALFWAMMQVRSKLATSQELVKLKSKQIEEKLKAIKKLTSEISKIKTAQKIQEKQDAIALLENEISLLRETETLSINDTDDVALPSYMLLIDEPEIALHPNAVRAASKYLYSLANDPSWQVMLTTHSPIFINPLEKHTTIVRIDRSENNPSPKTYISDKVSFSEEEIKNLKMLTRFDLNLAEMFFGQHPIIIEGDTEFAAFEAVMNKNPVKYPISSRPILIRARGKYTIPSLVKMLTHFKVPFTVLHDCDSIYNNNGNKNNAWTANLTINQTLLDSRSQGVKVIHRISIPYFEYAHIPLEVNDAGELIESTSKDKLYEMWSRVHFDLEVENSVMEVLDELININSPEETLYDDIESHLVEQINEWTTKHSLKDKRYIKD